MKIGIIVWPTDYSLAVRDLARLVEERGFESLFFPEHTHIPVSRRSPFPIGGDLPEPYIHNLDPFIAHAAAATVTERLKLGTGICLVAQRDPISLAKVIASLDYLSGGRVVLGVGGGWNVEEMENHRVPQAERWEVVEEHVRALKAIWTHEAASFSGVHTRFDALWSWPKPVQQPYPPVLVGGITRSSVRRVLAFGDGWIPSLDGAVMPLLTRIDDFRGLCDTLGRAVPPITVAFGFSRWANREELEHLQAAGVERSLLAVPATTYPGTVKVLDEFASVAAPWLETSSLTVRSSLHRNLEEP
jgi:probable F420-dependent oxidoreductase